MINHRWSALLCTSSIYIPSTWVHVCSTHKCRYVGMYLMYVDVLLMFLLRELFANNKYNKVWYATLYCPLLIKMCTTDYCCRFMIGKIRPYVGSILRKVGTEASCGTIPRGLDKTEECAIWVMMHLTRSFVSQQWYQHLNRTTGKTRRASLSSVA